VLGKWGKDQSLRWQIELIAGRTRDLANRIKRGLVAAPPRQRLKGKVQNMNDINWGGGTAANSGTLTFEAQVAGSGLTPISFTLRLYPGYTAFHVAAAFARAWNAVVPDPRYMAVAHQTEVLFPRTPAAMFGPNSRKLNGNPLNDDGAILNIPSFPELRANVFET